MTTDHRQTHLCPHCGKPGQRLGERPLDNQTGYHCWACGKLWVPDVMPTTSATSAARGASGGSS